MIFSQRDLERLKGVNPKLAVAIEDIFEQMFNQGHAMFVVMGVRTVAEQQALYAQGRTTPGQIVTYADGIVHKSNHQLHADGLGWAVDCAFLDVPDAFNAKLPWQAYGDLVESHGLTWGGRWKMLDLTHAELPDPGVTL